MVSFETLLVEAGTPSSEQLCAVSFTDQHHFPSHPEQTLVNLLNYSNLQFFPLSVCWITVSNSFSAQSDFQSKFITQASVDNLISLERKYFFFPHNAGKTLKLVNKQGM